MDKLNIIEEIIAEFEEWIDLNTNEELTATNKKQFEIIVGTALGSVRGEKYNPLIIEAMKGSYHSTRFPCDIEDSINAIPFHEKLVIEYALEIDPRSQYAGHEICLYNITRHELGNRIKYVKYWILKSDFDKKYKSLERNF